MNLPKLHRVTGEFSLMDSEKKELFSLTHEAVDEICKRCNSHAALVEALTKAENIIWRAKYEEAAKHLGHEGAYKWAHAHEHVTSIRAALASAKEGL